jgi:D-alanyl-D-alanine carboxypeptidase
MKLLKLSLLLLVFAAGNIKAVDSYEASFEDTAEFLGPEDTEFTPRETWAYHFELITPKGVTKLLTQQDTQVLVKPASTMKIFTGWWAFKMKNRTDSYLYQMLRRSDNNMAEATAQRLGGVLTMQDWYIEQGLPLDETNFIAADGSGLSYDNRATCEIEIKLLRMIKKDASYSRFKRLLAQPGKDGTLKTRLTGYTGKLFAKTGTLNRTASLSGFLETSKGTVVFCVLSDYLNISLTSARKKIDAMVKKNYGLAIAK